MEKEKDHIIKQMVKIDKIWRRGVLCASLMHTSLSLKLFPNLYI